MAKYMKINDVATQLGKTSRAIRYWIDRKTTSLADDFFFCEKDCCWKVSESAFKKFLKAYRIIKK